MRSLTIMAIVCIVAIVGCSSSASSPRDGAENGSGAPGTPSSSKSSPMVDGVQVTVDGKPFDLSGDFKVARENASGTSVLYIGKNANPSARVGGNGVLLQIQTSPGKTGFSTNDVATVTLTIWKGVEFSYVSVGAIPGQSVKGLVLAESSGELSGSFEADLNGSLGKIRGRVDFGGVLPW